MLIPKTATEFIAYVLDNDADNEEMQAALGVELIGTWGIYREGVAQFEGEENEDACIDRRFRSFIETVDKFPKGKVLSETAREVVLDCIRRFSSATIDNKLLRLYREEYKLFKLLERKIFLPEVQGRIYASVDDFTDDAKKITQARMARAGRALENHVEYILTEAGISFEMRREVDGTRPDVILPNKADYDDPHYPVHKLVMIGVKTTCKDRWRQVTKEAPRIPVKHILTLQESITTKQLAQMKQANVTLIVPKALHKKYPKERGGVTILDLESFVASMKRLHAT